MPLSGGGGGGGGGGRGLRRLVPSSHERSESRHKIILHLDSLREQANSENLCPPPRIFFKE